MTGILTNVGLALTRRWKRNLLTTAAMVIGVAALISVLAISQSSAQHLAETVNRLQANTILVSLPIESWEESEQQLVDSALSMHGVRLAGTFITSDAGTYSATVQQRATTTPISVATVVASESGLAARGGRLLSGDFPSEDAAVGDAVLIGSALASELGVSTELGSNTVLVNGVLVFVSGIVRDGAQNSEANTALVLPQETARMLGLLPQQRSLRIVVNDGAVPIIASIAPIALYPRDPGAVAVGTQPSPEVLRRQLLEDNRALLLTVTVVMVGATLFGIVTTMQTAVWERRRELGIIRAMGESRLRVGLQFLLESTGLGLAAGAVGYILGVLVSAAFAYLNNWTFILPPVAPGAIVLSGCVGAIAGCLPAWNASRISPASLLRST